MAETLTYQESEPNAESVVLNEAEQEALEVGEQMEKDAGNAKLAGKFDSPEQLEKAYMELMSHPWRESLSQHSAWIPCWGGFGNKLAWGLF